MARRLRLDKYYLELCEADIGDTSSDYTDEFHIEGRVSEHDGYSKQSGAMSE
jgi:hypothetical protein